MSKNSGVFFAFFFQRVDFLQKRRREKMKENFGLERRKIEHLLLAFDTRRTGYNLLLLLVVSLKEREEEEEWELKKRRTKWKRKLKR